MMQKVRYRAEEAAEERILDVLLPPAKKSSSGWAQQQEETPQNDDQRGTRQVFRKKLREGQLDDKEVEIDLAMPQMGVEIM
ncbi:hypothetical protein R0J89_18430, partial [Psychrobacter sp. SIMBA_152]